MTGWLRARWEVLAAGAAAGTLALGVSVVVNADEPPPVINAVNTPLYLLHTPPGLTGPAPLILVLPATGWSASQYRTHTEFDAAADRHRLHVAYVDPETAGGKRWNAGACCTHGPHRDDLAALRWVVGDIRSRVQVDVRRTAVVGGSGGGMMAFTAVCWAPETFTAAGVVAGSFVAASCPASVDVVRVHGLRDGVVPFRGGRGFEGVRFRSAEQVRAALPAGSRLVNRLRPWAGHTWEPGDAELLLRQFDAWWSS